MLATVLGLSFAALCTLHVALGARLSIRKPRWRGPVAIVVPPLGIIWAYREGLRRHAAGWLAACAIYFVARVVAEVS